MVEKFQFLPFDLVERSHWGARDPGDDMVLLTTPVQSVIHTYTDTEPCFDRGECIKRVRNLQARDLSLGLSDIRYNYLIGGEDGIYEGRGWKHLPDMHEDFPHLFERSIEIAHIGYEGEPLEHILHTVKIFLRHAVMKKFLRSNYKYIKHFKEIDKDEEHYMLHDDGKLELTCYKKLGQEVDRDETDEYKVLSDLSPNYHENFQEKSTEDTIPGFEGEDLIDYENNVMVDTSLLDDPEEASAIPTGKPETLSRSRKKKIS